jgi:hypothetical protein
MKALWSRIENAWCKVVHNQLMWPIHGYYSCRVCLRRYPVPWSGPLMTTALELVAGSINETTPLSRNRMLFPTVNKANSTHIRIRLSSSTRTVLPDHLSKLGHQESV